MKINLNDAVRVRLTEHGLEVLREHYTKMKIKSPVVVVVDGDGFSKFQLHELMYIFGQSNWNGAKDVTFIDNSIHTI